MFTLSKKKKKTIKNFLAKDLKVQCIGMNIKQKVRIKNTTYECIYLLETNFVGLDRFFVLLYSNQDDNNKMFKAQRCYLPKCVIKNYNVIINGKNI